MALEATLAEVAGTAVAFATGPVVVGLLRNAFGYLHNALEDGKLDKYEVDKLMATVVQYLGIVTVVSTASGDVNLGMVVAVVYDLANSVARRIGKK